jgi:predicted ATP-grasp superfamily ATP-dependent carboligase
VSTRVLIAGLSTRAAAQSAAQAGFLVTAIDAFGDLDQDPSVHSVSLASRFTAHAAACASRAIACDTVVYLANFENHPKAVHALAAGRTLWGNPPAVLRRVRDPLIVAHALERRGLTVPAVFVPGTEKLPLITDSLRWLVKPRSSGGGHGVRLWEGDFPPPPRCYLQELIPGIPGSLVFVAAGGRAVPLAFSRQLIGEAAFGAVGYQYCGSILAAAGDAQFPKDEALVARASALAETIASAFGLVGLSGIDFVARDGVPHLIEVNPRWSASLELAERAWRLSGFAAHAAACAAGELPDFDLARTRRSGGAVGKAIVFARRTLTIGDTRGWLDEAALGHIRDVPRPGERILAGRPVCTVFAAGRDGAACHAALIGRAERVYAELAAWESRTSATGAV